MQIAAKNIAKKYRNLIRKKPYGKPPLRKVTFKNDDLPINDLSNSRARDFEFNNVSDLTARIIF